MTSKRNPYLGARNRGGNNMRVRRRAPQSSKRGCAVLALFLGITAFTSTWGVVEAII